MLLSATGISVLNEAATLPHIDIPAISLPCDDLLLGRVEGQVIRDVDPDKFRNLYREAYRVVREQRYQVDVLD